jgi:hypothetical protein
MGEAGTPTDYEREGETAYAQGVGRGLKRRKPMNNLPLEKSPKPIRSLVEQIIISLFQAALLGFALVVVWMGTIIVAGVWGL